MYLLKNRIKRLMDDLKLLIPVRSKQLDRMEIRLGKLSFPCRIAEISDQFEPYFCGQIWSSPKYNDYALFRFNVEIPE